MFRNEPAPAAGTSGTSGTAPTAGRARRRRRRHRLRPGRGRARTDGLPDGFVWFLPERNLLVVLRAGGEFPYVCVFCFEFVGPFAHLESESADDVAVDLGFLGDDEFVGGESFGDFE